MASPESTESIAELPREKTLGLPVPQSGSITECDERLLGVMSLHLDNITDSFPFVLCPGNMLLGTVRDKVAREVELR